MAKRVRDVARIGGDRPPVGPIGPFRFFHDASACLSASARNSRIHEIPDPAKLFVSGIQAADPLTVPRIPLSATAQVRMVGNSVSPPQARALALANFRHEALNGANCGRQAARRAA